REGAHPGRARGGDTAGGWVVEARAAELLRPQGRDPRDEQVILATERPEARLVQSRVDERRQLPVQRAGGAAVRCGHLVMRRVEPVVEEQEVEGRPDEAPGVV